MSEIVNLGKAKTNLSQLIDRAVECEGIRPRRGVPLARLAAIAFIGVDAPGQARP